MSNAGGGGVIAWLLQRLSGLMILAYTAWLLLALLLLPDLHLTDWRGLFSGVWHQVAFLLFLLALGWHAWLGVKSVLMDYVPVLGLRLALLGLVALILLAEMLWAGRVLTGVIS